jgi:multisubunit Na+/H+ antiporter MnhG subunit
VRETISAILVLLGVGLELAAALGVATMRGVLQRMHFPGLAMVGSIPIAAAVVVRESISLSSLGALLLCAYLVVATPVLAHVTARAAGMPDPEDAREVDR